MILNTQLRPIKSNFENQVIKIAQIENDIEHGIWAVKSNFGNLVIKIAQTENDIEHGIWAVFDMKMTFF